MFSKNMLDPIIRAMVGVPLQFLGVILDLCNKFAGSDGKLWYEKIRTALREGVAKEVTTKVNAFLRLLPEAEVLQLSACNGTRTLAQAKDLFPSHIDSEFTSWGLDVVGVATPATAVQVYELVQGGDFAQLFGSLSANLDSLILTQDQIVAFCEEHRDWLHQGGYPTLFLFKVEGRFFVADVYVVSDGMRVLINQFEYVSIWRAENRPRLVSPQL